MPDFVFPGGQKLQRPEVTPSGLARLREEAQRNQKAREATVAEQLAALEAAVLQERDDTRQNVESTMAKMRRPIFRPSPLDEAPVESLDGGFMSVPSEEPTPEPGAHLAEGEFPVWFERGRPERQAPIAGQPAVNPYTGQPLRETPIFGGLGTVSEAFATPSDATIRFQNPYADANLSPMQQKMAAAEIGAIQDSMTRTKSKAVWDIVRKNGRKVKEILSDPTIPQSVKQQVSQQYAQEVEEAGKSTDPEELLETYEAQQDPAVALAKQKETWKHVFKARWKNEDMAEMVSSMGMLDPKTGQPNWDLAMKMALTFDKEYQDDQALARESRRNRTSALANLRVLAERAARNLDEPSYTQLYLAERSRFEEEYQPLPGVKPVYDEGEFDLAAELKALSSAGKVDRTVRNAQGYYEVESDADEEALQDEANRIGAPIEYIKNGELWRMTPEGNY